MYIFGQTLLRTLSYTGRKKIFVSLCAVKVFFYYTVNNNQNVKSTDKCNVYIICLITRNYCRLQICFVQIYISEVPNLKLKRCMILRFIRACLFLLCCFCYFSVCIALWSLFGVSLITAGLFIASALFKKKIKSAICCEMLKIKNTEEKLCTCQWNYFKFFVITVHRF